MEFALLFILFLLIANLTLEFIANILDIKTKMNIRSILESLDEVKKIDLEKAKDEDTTIIARKISQEEYEAKH